MFVFCIFNQMYYVIVCYQYLLSTDYGHTKARSLIFAAQIQIQIPILNKYLDIKPKGPQNFAQFVCPSPKVWDFWKKKSLWVSLVRVSIHEQALSGIQRLLTSYNVTSTQMRIEALLSFACTISGKYFYLPTRYCTTYLLNCKHEYYGIMHFFLGKFRQYQ